MKSTISFDPTRPIGRISPRLYGHFAEHLGRCCYEGLWVGRNSSIENIDGFRRDVVEALQGMVPLLRWPGGCYADHYHWRDGIGQTRPTRLGLSCGLRTVETNELGTHEFLALCRLIGAEPYFAGNMGSGSVQELCDWVEYCNADLATTLQQERASNGHAAPFGVKLWGVGNENWGCGGNYDPESYALEYRRYSCMMQHVDPTIEMVACGHDTDWNRRCIEKLKHHLGFVQHYSIHRYWIEGGAGSAFTDQEYYHLLEEAHRTEEFIIETRAFLDEATQGRHKIGIALDEWGVWHPEARTWGPGPVAGGLHDYSQACTMRDAIATAVGLEVFHRQCNSLSLANLAQITNVLHAPVMTDGAKMWLTPTYYVLQMHWIHMCQVAYPTMVDGNNISATASSGGVTIINRSLTDTVRVTIDGVWGVPQILTASSPREENSADNPNRVCVSNLDVVQVGSNTEFEMPPHSVATLVS
ncbi:MAG TPA: alpha-L-arabinofuranosidase C-terminal domain-containing protein [Fimbriimonas sp.]|nr:alpha-L-arabinofuranosidase C-terminal domain-containing protein [Fimbriimonas sp.]